VWICAGALVVALAAGLSRADSHALVYAGQLLGIALVFSGFAFVGKSAPRKRALAVRPHSTDIRKHVAGVQQ
jgi:hypothetical protein